MATEAIVRDAIQVGFRRGREVVVVARGKPAIIIAVAVGVGIVAGVGAGFAHGYREGTRRLQAKVPVRRRRLSPPK